MYNIRPVLKDGTRLGQLTGKKADSGFLRLFFRQRLHAEGQMGFDVVRDHQIVERLLLDPDPQLLLYYGKTFIARTIFTRAFDDWVEGKNVATILAVGENHILNRYSVAYPAGTEGRSQFTNVPVETIARSLVRWNCSPDAATDPSRILGAPAEALILPGTDNATGPTVTYSCFGKSVLEALQKLVEKHGGQFRLVSRGHRQWEFEFQWPRFIADKPNQIFSLERGNMMEPVVDHDRTFFKSHAYVGGRNQGQKRDFVVVSQPFGFYAETYVNASSDPDLTRIGNEKLAEHTIMDDFTFTVADPSMADLGEVWTAKYRNLNEPRLVVAREITVDRKGSLIKLETEKWTYGSQV